MIDLGTSRIRLTSSETIGRANIPAGSIIILIKFTQFNNQFLRPADLNAEIPLRGFGRLGCREESGALESTDFVRTGELVGLKGAWNEHVLGCGVRVRAKAPLAKTGRQPHKSPRNAPLLVSGSLIRAERLASRIRKFRQSSPVWSLRDGVETQKSSRLILEAMAPSLFPNLTEISRGRGPSPACHPAKVGSGAGSAKP